MTVIHGLKDIINILKVKKMVTSQLDFAKQLSANKHHINRIANNKVAFTRGFLNDINDFFNTDFVFHTDNEQLHGNNNDTQNAQTNGHADNNASVVSKSEYRNIPLINRYAYASFAEEWDHPEWLQEQTQIPTHVPDDGNYFWFEVRGDSMATEYRRSIEEGDHILGRELYRQHWRNLQYKRVDVWIILHKTRGIMVKQIINQEPNGMITCHSWNPTVEDFKISLNDVHLLFYFKEQRISHY